MKWQGKNWSSCFCTRTLQMGLPAGMTERGLASTLIIQSLAAFWNWNKKVTAWLEFLGHECGHARFTDSRLRRVYIQKMQAGTWYPDAPEPENEDEESALTEMNTYLTKKDPAVLSLLTECASYISNLLNDVYIEEKMCSLFPGSIKKGILVNRRRNVEWIPPLKELLEGNPDPVSVFLKVLVQYALRGYVNSWNMESCEMLDTLNEVKQFVDLSVTADSDLIRYQATNQILLKMWKYFRNHFGRTEAGMQGTRRKRGRATAGGRTVGSRNVSGRTVGKKNRQKWTSHRRNRRRKNHRRKNRQKKNQQGKKILQRKIEKRHPREMENPWEKRKKNPPQKKRNPKGKKNL